MEYRISLIYRTDEAGQPCTFDMDISDLYVESKVRIHRKLEEVLCEYDVSEYMSIICDYVFKYVLTLIQDFHNSKLKGEEIQPTYTNKHQHALVSLFNHFSQTGLLGDLDVNETGHFNRIFFTPTIPLLRDIRLFLVEEIRERLAFQVKRHEKEVADAPT